ncbi:hypothetical protein [Sphingomonas sp. 3-13AW]|uniref:hypothetical protein n=1 Tax=Sphingomonas sp. 3-13AW TaxID=3050450 RepID=UPI003BB6F696
MTYDYDEYCARFDTTCVIGIRDLLQQALVDWRDGHICDEQFDDLVKRAANALSELASHVLPVETSKP